MIFHKQCYPQRTYRYIIMYRGILPRIMTASDPERRCTLLDRVRVVFDFVQAARDALNNIIDEYIHYLIILSGTRHYIFYRRYTSLLFSANVTPRDLG